MTDPNPDAVWFCTRCAFLGTAAEADAHAQPTHLLSPLRTRTGKIVTNEEVDRWVEEAERGYDLAALRPVDAGRRR